MFDLFDSLAPAPNVTVYGKTRHMGSAQYAFLVAQVEISQSPDFVIYMSNNLLTVAIFYGG